MRISGFSCASIVLVAALVAGCGAPLPTVAPTGAPTTSEPTPAPDTTWQHLDDFPPEGSVLLDIATTGTGFVIGGSAESPTDSCASQRDARIWSSSPDGRTWSQQEVGGDANASVTAIAGQLAVGRTGCGQEQPVAWRLAVTDWLDLVVDGLDPRDEVTDLVGSPSGPFTASGNWALDDDTMGIWVASIDGKAGIDWQRASDPPPAVRSSTLSSLVAGNGRYVGFDTTREPYAWYSVDADIWNPSDLRPDYGLLTTDATAYSATDFLAAGRGCCGLPDQRFGTIVASTDGQTWTESRPQHFANPIEAVTATDFGLIAVGTETYLSSDGMDWRLGPPLPGYIDRVHVVNREPVPYRLKLAVAGQSVVAMSPTDVWVASLETLDADRWPEAAPEADMPDVGQSYEATLPTHCGPFNGPLYFAARSWIPDLPEGAYPLSFDYYYETGQLKYTGADGLEFTGAKGDVVSFMPTEDPPHGAPCH